MSFLDNFSKESLEGHKSALQTLISNSELQVKNWKQEIKDVDVKLKSLNKDDSDHTAPKETFKDFVDQNPTKEEDPKEEVVKEEPKEEPSLPDDEKVEEPKEEEEVKEEPTPAPQTKPKVTRGRQPKKTT